MKIYLILAAISCATGDPLWFKYWQYPYWNAQLNNGFTKSLDIRENGRKVQNKDGKSYAEYFHSNEKKIGQPSKFRRTTTISASIGNKWSGYGMSQGVTANFKSSKMPPSFEMAATDRRIDCTCVVIEKQPVTEKHPSEGRKVKTASPLNSETEAEQPAWSTSGNYTLNKVLSTSSKIELTKSETDRNPIITEANEKATSVSNIAAPSLVSTTQLEKKTSIIVEISPVANFTTEALSVAPSAPRTTVALVSKSLPLSTKFATERPLPSSRATAIQEKISPSTDKIINATTVVYQERTEVTVHPIQSIPSTTADHPNKLTNLNTPPEKQKSSSIPTTNDPIKIDDPSNAAKQWQTGIRDLVTLSFLRKSELENFYVKSYLADFPPKIDAVKSEISPSTKPKNAPEYSKALCEWNAKPISSNTTEKSQQVDMRSETETDSSRLSTPLHVIVSFYEYINETSKSKDDIR